MPTKTKVEIIEETVDYYIRHARGMSTAPHRRASTCVYLDARTGAKCAVGRCMESPSSDWSSCPSEGIEYIDDEGETRTIDFESHLIPEYRGHSAQFWDALQGFHDWNYNWEKVGLRGNRLTSTGFDSVQDLIEKWKDK